MIAGALSPSTEAHKPSASTDWPGTYRPDVDGLRALAIVPVVIFHAFPTLAPGGFVGVDVFFVISGYLISSIIFGGLEHGRFTFRQFYVRRIKRIFPALLLVLVTCLLWGWFGQFSDDYALLGKHVAGGAGFIANFLYWNEAGYFDAASNTKPLLHLWSLGIEEQFYLLWPSVLFLCWTRRIPLLPVIVGLATASFAVNAVQARSDEVAAFYAPWTRLWELLIGGGFAYVSRGQTTSAWIERWWPDLSGSQRTTLTNAASVIGALFVIAAIAIFDGDTSFPGWRAALPTVGTLLVIAAGSDAWLNRHVLARPWIVWVGLISYPLYLWHWPLLSYARLAEAGTPSVSMRLAIVGVSVVLAWLTYAVVERRIRFRPTGRAVVPALCLLMLTAGVGGYVTYAAGGFINRPINRSDQAHFLRYYTRMRTDGRLQAAYRSECDFMNWETEKNRAAIDPSCTEGGARGTVFLWGDSHAQALSLGLRSILPDGVRLAQVTTSGCAPRLSEPNPEALSGRCQLANAYARERIAALKPDLVVLAQILAHPETDWVSLADALHGLGARRVLLVGPAPQWHPPLPEIVTHSYWDKGFARVEEGLDPAMFEIDRTLRDRLQGASTIQYVSLVAPLCNESGCLATVPGTDRELMAVDSGHFSPGGSRYVADVILRAQLPSWK